MKFMTLTPNLMVEDVLETVDFYRGKFGVFDNNGYILVFSEDKEEEEPDCDDEE